MTNDNLVEFLSERVMATRQTHTINYPLDNPEPEVAVVINSADDAMAVVILPTIGKDVLFLDLHYFVDGERVTPASIGVESGTPITIYDPSEANGRSEHLLRRPDLTG